MLTNANVQAAEQAGESMRRAVAGLGPAVAGLAVALEQLGRALHAAAWHSYIMAGAPYGETREGLRRWMREQQRNIDNE